MLDPTVVRRASRALPALILLLVLAAGVAASPPARAAGKAGPGPGRPSDLGAYLVIDLTSGQVLAEKNAWRPWHPASITKLMTTYVAFRAIRAGHMRMSSPVVVTATSLAEPPSKMGLPLGTTLTLETALKFLIVKSANDMAVAIAEAVAGSEAEFVVEMNRQAARLGMVRTHFENPNGLPDDAQVTTARDMVLLARAIDVEFPEYRSLFRIQGLKFGKMVIRSHNRMLMRYPGADGYKTGFICASGFNIVASATRGGRRLLAVTLGGPSALSRDQGTAELLEAAFVAASTVPAKRMTLDRFGPDEATPLTPVDLKRQICGGERRKPAGEDIDDDFVPGVKLDPGTDPAGKQRKDFLLPPPPKLDLQVVSTGGADPITPWRAARGELPPAAGAATAAAGMAAAAEPTRAPGGQPLVLGLRPTQTGSLPAEPARAAPTPEQRIDSALEAVGAPLVLILPEDAAKGGKP